MPVLTDAGCRELTKTLNQNGSRGHRHVEPMREYACGALLRTGAGGGGMGIAEERA